MKCIVRIAGIEYTADYIQKLCIGHLVKIHDERINAPTAVGPNEVIRFKQRWED